MRKQFTEWKADFFKSHNIPHAATERMSQIANRFKLDADSVHAIIKIWWLAEAIGKRRQQGSRNDQ